MGNLSRLAVKRPVTFIMMALIVLGFGLYGLSNLRLNLYPDVSFPTVTIYTTYEGVAPEDMETLISRPIEESVGSISGVLRVRSLSSQGSSVVKLYFDWGTDLYQAESDVRKRLDFVRRSVPDDAEQPIVFSYDPNEEPIVVLTLTSETRNPRELRTLATQQLEQRFERINGIASAETAGGYERQINIRISNEQLRLYNISFEQVASRLNAENIQVPAGELIEGNKIYSLRTIGEFKTVEEIENVVVALESDKTVRLKDVASVEDGVAQPIGGVHVQGDDGIVINLYKQSDSNVVTAAGSVIESLEDIKKVIPEDTELKILTNRADFIELSITNLVMTGLQAIILVVLILLFFLQNGRSALIIAVSIPVSIIATFSVMDLADLSLNVISLSGLTLAVGMVVDDAVVVLENIFKFREDGYNVKTSAVDGAREVAVPVIISTLTTLVVFLPILFVPGITGILFRDLALTVSFALAISTLVAVTLIPLLSSKILTPKTEAQLNRKGKLDLENDISRMKMILAEGQKSIFKRILSYPKVFFFAFIFGIRWMVDKILVLLSKIAGLIRHVFAAFLQRQLQRLEDAYKRQLKATLNHSGWVIFAAFALLAGTVPLFYLIGGEYFPPVDENRFVLEVQREPGVNIYELERTFSQVEAVLEDEVPEARLIVSDFGDKKSVEGADNPGGYHGKVRVELVPTTERNRSQFEIVADVLEELQMIPGASIKEVRENPLSPEGENGLIVQIYGYDLDTKAQLAKGVKEQMQEISGVTSVFSTADQGRPELRVTMDRERIARVGLNTSQVANTLGNAVKGNLATSFVDQGMEFDILVELSPREKTTAEDLNQLQIQTPGGTWMPLSNLARIERYNGPTNILRINQERVAEVTAELGDVDLKTATQQTRAKLEQMNWPDGYRYQFGGTAEEQEASFNYLLIAFMIAGLLTYMVMASQFESLMEPFIILFTIPLALSGVLIMLAATGTPVSVTSMIGLILLTGIVVNNGIVMIDYIKILQVRGYERREAIIEGATRRMRPILMTAFTTILSMVPLALELGAGSETWSPMARTVIGGLTMSTLLMLFVVPSLYNVINTAVERLGFDSVHANDPISEKSTLAVTD